MTITIISNEWQQFVLLLHHITEQNTPTATKQVHEVNILHVSWTCVQCVRWLSHYAVTPDDDAIHRRPCRWTIAVVSAMSRQSLVSVRQLRRNFDDGRPRPSAEGHPRIPAGIINLVQIQAIRWPYISDSMNCTFSHCQKHGALGLLPQSIARWRHFIFQKSIQINYDLMLKWNGFDFCQILCISYQHFIHTYIHLFYFRQSP